MYCARCGAKVPDDAKFCTECGSTIIPGYDPGHTGGDNAADDNMRGEYGSDPYGTEYGNETGNEGRGYQYTPIDPSLFGRTAARPMAWYKFLIYFSLWAGAVINFVQGVGFITGKIYDYISKIDNASAAAYEQFPALKTVDIIAGIAFIAFAVFVVYVRFRLAGFKKNGPNMLLVSYVALGVISLAYFFASSAIVGSSKQETTSTIIGTVLGIAILFIANKIYFDKRKDLFVN